MMQKSAPALAALALVLTTACGGNPWVVDSYQAPETDVASRHSFAWRTGEVGAPLVLRPQLAADVQSRIRAVVTQELLKKGYVEATDPAGADMTVSFQVTGAPRTVESEQPRFGAPSPNQVLTPGSVPPRPASELPREMLIREGTVMVLAEDPASGRLMWRGLVRAEIRTSSLDRTVDKVVDIARHIAQAFPARSAAP